MTAKLITWGISPIQAGWVCPHLQKKRTSDGILAVEFSFLATDVLQSFWLRFQRRGSILTPTESAQAFCKKETSAADHLTCHFQGHCATLVSLPFWPLQSTSVCARAAAGSVSDLQGIQPFIGGLERALLLHLVMALHLYPLFTALSKLLKKESLNHALLTDPQALSSTPMCCLLFSQNPPSTDVWKQFIVWMCDLWERGEENQWQFFKSLFVLELDQDCILWSFISHPLPYMKERVLLLTLMMCWRWWSDEMGKSPWIKFCCWLSNIKRTDSYFCIPAFDLETFLNLLRPLPNNDLT